MQAMNERFEMRLDQDTLRAVDTWRSRQDDVPSRAEAIRRLVESGLSGSADAPLRFSPGEILLTHMMCELFRALKVNSEFDPKFVQAALLGGHLWALEWEYSGTFHRHLDDSATVAEVVDIFDMWDFIEAGYEELSKKDKDRVKKDAEPYGDDPKFLGFDGNNESKHHVVARFFVDDMGRFSRFKERDLNSHCPSLNGYRHMLEVFEPIRATLSGGGMTASQIVQVLNARKHSEGPRD